MPPHPHMNSENDTDIPQTVQDFRAWQQVNSAVLAAAHERHEREIQAIVLRSLVPMLQRGYSMQEAGDILLRNLNYGTSGSFTLTRAAARRALVAMGREPAGRTKGSDA